MPTAAATVCSQPRCPHPVMERGRCALHRQTTNDRGYGIAHQSARQALRATLPALCGYGCGVTLTPDGEWVAAHVVDGDASKGYVASCVACNQRAKNGRLRVQEGSPVEKSHVRGRGGLTRAANRGQCQNDSDHGPSVGFT